MLETRNRARQRLHCSKKYYFKVCLADPDDYLDFKSNPTNPLTELSEDYRMDDLVKTLGAVWAETALGSLKKGIDQ